MTPRTRVLALSLVGSVLVASTVVGQDLSRYRGFELGSGIAAVAKTAGVAPATARTTYKTPALLQELEARPSRWVAGSTVASTDPVEQMLFSFYNDQLFRVVVDYVRDRTEGMTDADLIASISTIYGPALSLKGKTAVPAASRPAMESGDPVARWGDGSHAVVLYQMSSYGTARRLVVTALATEDLALKAETQAKRTDEQEAPAREAARDKKDRDAAVAAEQKARATNNGAFKP